MRLRRQLGLLGIFCIAAGAMISSGLFVLPGILYEQVGPGMVLAYLLAGFLMVPTMLAKAELATAMPKAGGTYFYIERSLGALAGTLGGLAHWISIGLKSAFALVGMGAFVGLFLPEVPIKIVAVGACLALTLVNLLGTKETERLQVGLVLALLGILVGHVVLGGRFVQETRFFPFMPYSFRALLAATGMVFISYGGLTKIAGVAEEVRDPGRNIPLGMFLAFFSVTLLYVLSVGVTVGLLEPEELRGSLMPLVLGAKAALGTTGEVVMALAALAAFLTTANAGILTASRSPMAMSRDGLLPGLFRQLGRRSGMPYWAVSLTGGFMSSAILFLDVQGLVKVASTMMLVLFVFENLALIIMRESGLQSYRPKFRVPLYPWMPLFGIGAYGLLLVEMGRTSLEFTGAFLALALLWYGIYVRLRVRRRSALVHLVERITDRQLGDGTLEEELVEMLRERDDITEDRFDELIRSCPVLDLEGPLSAEECFREVAGVLSERLRIGREELFRRLVERERQSTTAVQPGLAIPHIVIEGRGKFAVLPVRCRKGVRFREELPPVNVLFVLAGTPDERTFHLQVLMAIAQIVQDKGFLDAWGKAKGPEDLRRLILLAERKRP